MAVKLSSRAFSLTLDSYILSDGWQAQIGHFTFSLLHSLTRMSFLK
jgi:hypothetical protein